jgi:hypothetical protein
MQNPLYVLVGVVTLGSTCGISETALVSRSSTTDASMGSRSPMTKSTQFTDLGTRGVWSPERYTGWTLCCAIRGLFLPGRG